MCKLVDTAGMFAALCSRLHDRLLWTTIEQEGEKDKPMTNHWDCMMDPKVELLFAKRF